MNSTKSKNKICPIMAINTDRNVSKRCVKENCEWWCDFAKSCSVPLLEGMFADSDICKNTFEKNINDVCVN